MATDRRAARTMYWAARFFVASAVGFAISGDTSFVFITAGIALLCVSAATHWWHRDQH